MRLPFRHSDSFSAVPHADQPNGCRSITEEIPAENADFVFDRKGLQFEGYSSRESLGEHPLQLRPIVTKGCDIRL